MASHDVGPTPLDRCFQLGYRLAYRLMRAYWRVRRPRTRGALVAIWNEGALLLVKNSYIPYYSLPGGYLRRNETPRQAAVRELAEEIGLTASEAELELVVSEINEWEGKQDGVEIFALELGQRPAVHIDHREVVEAAWFPPEQALKLQLFPPIRRAIERHQQRAP